jgi:proline dehydrogenase
MRARRPVAAVRVLDDSGGPPDIAGARLAILTLFDAKSCVSPFALWLVRNLNGISIGDGPGAGIMAANTALRFGSKETDTTSPLRHFILWLSTKKSVTDFIARRGMKYGFARRFVGGETLAEAIAAASELGRAGRRVTLNQLGENVATAPESRQSCDSYLEMLRALEGTGLDASISVKLTHLGLDLDAKLCCALTLEIAAQAAALGRTLEIDMESSAYTDRTIEIFEAAQRQYRNVGLAIQASLRRSEADLERLSMLEPKIRLVKGAYLEPPAVAFQKKSEVDANYRKLLDVLLKPRTSGRFVAAIATHDPALIDFAQRKVEEYAVPKSHYEFQMLFGIRRDLQEEVHAAGHPLRVYIPFGSAWCPYFMRRLAERPANIWFLIRSLAAENKPSSGKRAE